MLENNIRIMVGEYKHSLILSYDTELKLTHLIHRLGREAVSSLIEAEDCLKSSKSKARFHDLCGRFHENFVNRMHCIVRDLGGDTETIVFKQEPIPEEPQLNPV